MSLETIKVIKEVEEEAEVIRKASLQRAREIIRQAENDGDGAIESSNRQVQAQGQEKLEQAKLEAQAEIKMLEDENLVACKNIAEKAQGKLQEASAFIMGRIVKSHGNN